MPAPDELDPGDELRLPDIPDPEPMAFDALPDVRVPPGFQDAHQSMLADDLADKTTIGELDAVTEAMHAADEPAGAVADARSALADIEATSNAMADAEAPRPGYPRENARRTAADADRQQAEFLNRESGAPPRPEQQGDIPSSFEEFLKGVRQMRAEGGRTGLIPGAAMRAAKQRYEQILRDQGMEALPGQEHIEVEAREREQVFHQAEKQVQGVQLDWMKLVTQSNIEMFREITRLNDALLRNRQ